MKLKKINDTKNALEWLESVSTRFRPKSMDIFERVLDFTKLFEQLSESEKSCLVSSMSDDVAQKLLAFSAFFSELAMSTDDKEWIKGAIILHVVEDFRKDYRENFRYLVLIAHGAAHIKADFGDAVQSVLQFASTRTRDYLIDFVRRDNDLNDLEKFGIKVEMVNSNPRFVQM